MISWGGFGGRGGGGAANVVVVAVVVSELFSRRLIFVNFWVTVTSTSVELSEGRVCLEESNIQLRKYN